MGQRMKKDTVVDCNLISLRSKPGSDEEACLSSVEHLRFVLPPFFTVDNKAVCRTLESYPGPKLSNLGLGHPGRVSERIRRTSVT